MRQRLLPRGAQLPGCLVNCIAHFVGVEAAGRREEHAACLCPSPPAAHPAWLRTAPLIAWASFLCAASHCTCRRTRELLCTGPQWHCQGRGQAPHHRLPVPVGPEVCALLLGAGKPWAVDPYAARYARGPALAPVAGGGGGRGLRRRPAGSTPMRQWATCDHLLKPAPPPPAAWPHPSRLALGASSAAACSSDTPAGRARVNSSSGSAWMNPRLAMSDVSADHIHQSRAGRMKQTRDWAHRMAAAPQSPALTQGFAM